MGVMEGVYDPGANWRWSFTHGCLAIVLGLAALGHLVTATSVSVIVLAFLMILGGAAEAVYLTRNHERGPVVLYTLEALFGVAIGLLLLRSPGHSASLLTKLLLAYFVFEGLFRIVAAFMLWLPRHAWLLVSGMFNLVFAVVAYGGWPVPALWMLGFYIGITMIFSGWARLEHGLALKSHRLEPLQFSSDRMHSRSYERRSSREKHRRFA